MDTHIDSSKHMRYREQKRYSQREEQSQQHGENPEWMEIRDGVEYCTLCWNYATEGHILSLRHQKRVSYQQGRFEGAQPPNNSAAVPPSSTMPGAAAAAVAAGRPPPLPPGWGNPDFFEWKPET